jgi:hypothetical protein
MNLIDSKYYVSGPARHLENRISVKCRIESNNSDNITIRINSLGPSGLLYIQTNGRPQKRGSFAGHCSTYIKSRPSLMSNPPRQILNSEKIIETWWGTVC